MRYRPPRGASQLNRSSAAIYKSTEKAAHVETSGAVDFQQDVIYESDARNDDDCYPDLPGVDQFPPVNETVGQNGIDYKSQESQQDGAANFCRL